MGYCPIVSVEVAALIVSIISVLVAAGAGFGAYKVADRQRGLQERITKIEEKRSREERRDRWLRINPLPVVYPPVGQQVSVKNVGGSPGDVRVRVVFQPPRWAAREACTATETLRPGEDKTFDISRGFEMVVAHDYVHSLPDLERVGVARHMRIFAEVMNGPHARTCVYWNAAGRWIQADWDVVKEIGGTDRIESVLPPPPSA
jgi:hypothetical protein